MADLSPSGISLLIWISVFTVWCALILVLRFWAARLSKRRIFLDDYFVCFAFANTLALAGTAIWGIYNGLGAHTSELNEYQIGVQFKLVLSAGVTWLLSTVFLKLSMVLLYTRIFTNQIFRRWSRIVIAIIAAYGISFLCVFFTNCMPISQQWDPVPGGSCRDISIEELTSVSLNMALDLVILVLPLPPLWRLQMAVRNKIFISCLFSLGLLTVGISIWRIQVTKESLTNPDFVSVLSTVALISFLELWLGQTVACVPTLAPLAQHYLKPTLSKIYKGYKQKATGLHNLPSSRRSGPIPGRKVRVGGPWTDDDTIHLHTSGEHMSHGGTLADTAIVAVSSARDDAGSSGPSLENQILVQHDIEISFIDGKA